MGAPPWLSAAPAAAGPEGMSGNLISRDKLQSFLLADLGCQCVNLFCLICAIVVKAENGAYDCGFWKSGTCDKDRVDNGPSMVFVGYYVWFYPLLISLIFRSVMNYEYCSANFGIILLFTAVYYLMPVFYMLGTAFLFSEYQYLNTLSVGLLLPISLVIGTLVQWTLKCGSIGIVHKEAHSQEAQEEGRPFLEYQNIMIRSHS